MRAMVYRGPYKIRVEEKDIPSIEHPNDAIVRVTMGAIVGADYARTTPSPRPECSVSSNGMASPRESAASALTWCISRSMQSSLSAPGCWPEASLTAGSRR